MVSKVLAHMEESTSSAYFGDMTNEEAGRNFNHFMGDMMAFHWGSWSPLLIFLWWIIWILVIIALSLSVVAF